MNKTLLLILCDFLLLNLLALTRWEKAEPARAKQPPVPALAANAATKDQDLVETMKLSLTDERTTRDQLVQQLSATESTLTTREQTLAQLQVDKTKLAASLGETQHNVAELGRKAAAAAQETTLTREQLARLQLELEQKRAEASRQSQSLADLQRAQAEARLRIEGLNVAVQVAEREKALLRERAEALRLQVENERQERIKVQATATQLAQGVTHLAEKSGELTQEIRESRPLNANVLFSDYLANRVATKFTAVRAGVFSPSTREKESSVVLVTDGVKTYALLHVDDTPFPLVDSAYDWERVAIEFTRPPDYRSRTAALHFLSLDPRVIALPVDAAQASALGVKPYRTAREPFKFPEAVLVNGGGKGYGEVGFKLDAAEPGYVRVDNRFFKRLFGNFAPSRGDLVISKTGELLGIMVNSDYCALVTSFRPARTLATGDDIRVQRTSDMLNNLAATVRALPLKLQ